MPPKAPRRLIPPCSPRGSKSTATTPSSARTGRTETRHRHERLLRASHCRRSVRAAGNHLASSSVTHRHGRRDGGAFRRLSGMAWPTFAKWPPTRIRRCWAWPRTHLGVPVSKLTVADASSSGGGKKHQLRPSSSQGQQLRSKKFQLPGMRGEGRSVLARRANGLEGLDGFHRDGRSPDKTSEPVTRSIRTSYPMPGIPDKITREDPWTATITCRNASCPYGAAQPR